MLTIKTIKKNTNFTIIINYPEDKFNNHHDLDNCCWGKHTIPKVISSLLYKKLKSEHYWLIFLIKSKILFK